MYTIKKEELEVGNKKNEAEAYSFASTLAMQHPGLVFTVWKDNKKIGTLIGKPDNTVSTKFSSLNKAVFTAINLTKPDQRGRLYVNLINSEKFQPARIEDIN
jgi:hypothetical protein